MTVLLQQHAYDITSACRRLTADYDAGTHPDNGRPDDTGQHQMIGHVHGSPQQLRRVQFLQCFLRRIYQTGHDIHDQRSQHGRHDGTDTQFRPEQHHRKNQQRDIKHVSERSHLNGREQVMEYDTGPVHSSGHDIIRIDEKHKSGSQNGASYYDASPCI